MSAGSASPMPPSTTDASVFHIGEARWLRDRRYAADYIDYMYRGGNDRHFSD